ncbi:MAG: hypothetical protein HPY44_02020 [Armatimonadetes bacterium]|nr:hypothetical protein [Armatimonadota bacterium]
MSILSWLQRIVADFFCADTNDQQRAIAQAEAELEVARTAAALSVARAHRARLELQDAIAEGDAPAYQLLGIAEDADERARRDISNYRERRDQLERVLRRADEAGRLERENREREKLREFIQRAEAARDRAALEKLETQALEQAARLDVLDALDRGEAPDARHHGAGFEERVRRLLDRPLSAELNGQL